MEYKSRNIYLDKIKPFIGQQVIKVIVGQRRVGKSYLLFQVIDQIKQQDPHAHIIYISKELYEYDTIKDYNDLNTYFYEHRKAEKNNYFLIDEIQEIEAFERCLRSIQAKQEADIYITGSNANLLSSELSTFLSGRYIEIKVYSLSYREYLQFHDEEKSQQSFLKYLQYGGLPGVMNLPDEDRVIQEYIRNIYATILFKDIVKLNNIRNVSFLENLIKYVADNVGSIVSSKKISDFLKSQQIQVTPNKVLDYLKHLEMAFFLFKVNRSDINGKKIFEIGEKYYLEDLGLRNVLVGYKQQDINKLLENIVYIHLKIAGYEVYVGWDDGKEIDFVCHKNNQKEYIQVAYQISDEKVREREFGNLQKIGDNYPKKVLSMDVLIESSYEGIEHKNIIDFLWEI